MKAPDTIPATVALLTLNAAATLPECLEALRNFQEIIVCDGNSTDRTQDIAREYGATVVNQYDTEEPNVPCAIDKAAVRERAFAAATLDWRFFMDADDALSKETVEEIRRIVTDPNPTHFVWRMPTRIFIDSREILHEATYPSYQTRLVHKKIGAHFKGPVHDRLIWDEKKFPIGTMQTRYDFHWDKDRVENLRHYLDRYIAREIQTLEFGTVRNFLYWGVWFRLRVIAGYILWRIPRMYLRFGFKDSMPLWIEMETVRYHVALFFKGIMSYIRSRLWCEVLVGTMQGKDINRILFNIAVRPFEAYGRVLDIGGGKDASYWRYLSTRRWFRKTILDIDPSVSPDITADLEKDDLSQTNHFDTALLFNVLEHLHQRPLVLSRIRRTLKGDGVLIGVVPFLVAVHPDPHDYARMTAEELHILLSEAGFSRITIEPVGRGPIMASFYQSEFLWPRLLKLVILPIVFTLDAVIVRLRPAWRDKFPLSYMFVAR